MEQLGIPPQILRRVAICAYEAEMNLIIHTDSGGELVTEIQPDLIHMTITDHGPGIVDVEQAMYPGIFNRPSLDSGVGFRSGNGVGQYTKVCRFLHD